MPSAVSSCRDDTYWGAPCEGAASASHSGAQSEPGEAKMRSTPIAPSALRRTCPPVTALLQALCSFLREAQVGVLRYIHFPLEQPELGGEVEVRLQRLQVGHQVRVAIVVAVLPCLEEEPFVERSRRPLADARRDL